MERVNGHRLTGLVELLHPAFKAAERPNPEELSFDLEGTLAAVVSLNTKVPQDAFTASILGTSREGNGVVIDRDGLVLTIGYLIAEADEMVVADGTGQSVEAEFVAYDYDTGFGLVRALTPLGISPLAFGNSAGTEAGDPVIIGTRGGLQHAISGRIVAKREFAGYWEYMLDEAIFTAPPHVHWGGAALIGTAGELLGIGSLFVEDALQGEESVPGNMFVPIDLLKPIFENLLRYGRVPGAPRPWLGVFATDTLGHLVVTGVAPEGPAHKAGVKPGDVIVRIGGQLVTRIADLYRIMWDLGSAGVQVPLTVMRESSAFDIHVRSGDRYAYLKMPERG